MEKVLWRLENGQGKISDINLLADVAKKIEGNTICPLGDAFCGPITSFLEHFGHEFEEAIARAGSRAARHLPILPVRSGGDLSRETENHP